MKPTEAGQNDQPEPAEAKTGVGGFQFEIKSHWRHYVSLGVVCLMIIGFWIWSAEPGGLDYPDLRSEKAYYNLLVDGFRSGQLNLKTEAPPELAQLPNPYDLKTSLLFGLSDGHPLLDLSYYHGKLYLCFGVTPALVLFWPCAALTGHYLPHKDAILIFCAAGFLASVGLLYALWRRCFAEVGFGVVVTGALALGLATGLPMLFSKCDVYEVAISCGFAFVMLALAAVWMALASPQKQGWWLAAASLAYGLALGARPDLLFGAGILLIPVLLAWRRRERIWGQLLAALGPVVLIGLGLMFYNEMRFGDPLEFGQRYQLGARHDSIQHFSLRYFWYDFRVYFLEPVQWSGSFPFVREIRPTPAPAGSFPVEFAFNVLTCIPFVWLALAAPLAWRDRPPEIRSLLRGMLAALTLIFGTCALTLSFFWAAIDRYEVEFVPALVLLAVVGVLSLERAGIGPRWRQLARWGWSLLLVLSVGFNLLHAIERRAFACNVRGVALEVNGRVDAAIRQYREAIRFKPDYEEPHFNLANALLNNGQMDEAARQFREALRCNPGDALAEYDLGVALDKEGQTDGAIRQYQEVIRLKPDFGLAQAYYNLGIALAGKGQTDEAIHQFQEAILCKPDYADAHYNLGTALFAKGRVDEAIRQYQEVIKLEPGDAIVHSRLGSALAAKGRVDEAIRQFQEVIRLNPGSGLAEAHYNLGVALARQGWIDEAIFHFQEATRLKPDYADAHYNLGNIFIRAGEVDGAVLQFQEVIRLEPDSAEARNNLGIALYNKGQFDEAIRQFQEAVRLKPDYADAQNNLTHALGAKNAPPDPDRP